MMKKIKQAKRIYLDHAATTPVDPRVQKATQSFLSGHFGNPGSFHKEGVYAKQVVADARKRVAAFLHAGPSEIIFVSGGTEANNLAIFGFTKWLEEKGCRLKDLHFIGSAIEHPSVLDCFRNLQKRGATVSSVSVTKEGILNLSELKTALKPNTVFVSIMMVNNEIGTVQPISEIAKTLRNHRKKNILPNTLAQLKMSFPFFHTDACQAPLFYEMNTQKLGADFLSLDGQKIYGPKGVGMLFVKRNSPLSPLFYGGGQERGFRPGTENVPGIVGFVEALRIAEEERGTEATRLTSLRDYFIEKLFEKIPRVELNGDRKERSPNNINVSIPGTDNEWIVLQLDAKGIAVGTRSACMTDEGDSSVVRALGKGGDTAKNSLRFTLGRETTKKDIDYVLKILVGIVERG